MQQRQYLEYALAIPLRYGPRTNMGFSDELLASWGHHEVEIFQRNLAQEIRHRMKVQTLHTSRSFLIPSRLCGPRTRHSADEKCGAQPPDDPSGFGREDEEAEHDGNKRRAHQHC